MTSGAVSVSILFPNFFCCLTAVVRGEVYDFSLESFADNTFTIESQILLGLSWICGTSLSMILLAFRQGGLHLKDLFRGPNRPSITPSVPKKKFAPPSYYQPPSVSLNAFNMFDPADLPPRLAEYAIMVYSACEDLGNFFGFQDSSVRNQAEHLLILLSNNRRYMSNHILPPTVQPPSPIHALHAKVFSNYMKWCRAMGVPPNFSKMNSAMAAPPAVTSRVVDLVLFFCIWGEAANIRHMPECLWFLYHKMMEEYTLSEGYVQTRSLYAGYFLDQVVTPIYDIIAKVCCCIISANLLFLTSSISFTFSSHDDRVCNQEVTIKEDATTMTSMSSFGPENVSDIDIHLNPLVIRWMLKLHQESVRLSLENHFLRSQKGLIKLRKRFLKSDRGYGVF